MPAVASVARHHSTPLFNLDALEPRSMLSAPTLTASAALLPRVAIITQPSPNLKAVGLTIRAFVKRSFSGDVGLLKNLANVASDFRNLHAWIDWGDGSDSTPATFGADATGTIHIRGTHTYAKPGHFAITIKVAQGPICDPSKPCPFFAIRIATIHSTAIVSPLGQGLTIQATAGQPFSGKVASVAAVPSPIAIATLAATIDWGDGTTTDGALTPDGNGRFDISGTHTYQSPGTFDMLIIVSSGPHCTAGQPCPLFPTILIAKIHSTAIVAPA